MNIADFEAILFDFGNTMADEDFFKRSSKEIPDFSKIMTEHIYKPYYADPFGDNLLNLWMKGEKNKSYIALHIAKSIDKPVGNILKLIETCCRNLDIYTSVFEFAKNVSSFKKTAIVTINADIFSEYVVDEYNLNKTFPVIVNSFYIRTLSKTDLCMEALKLLESPLEKSLLIDNTKKWCDEYESIGGNAYFFEGEEKFVSDFGL